MQWTVDTPVTIMHHKNSSTIRYTRYRVCEVAYAVAQDYSEAVRITAWPQIK